MKLEPPAELQPVRTGGAEPLFLLKDGAAVAQPGQIRVAGRRLVMIVPRHGRRRTKGAGIHPLVILDVAISKGDNPAMVVRSVGVIEEGIVIHVHTEVRPADAVWIDVLEGKHHSGRDFGGQFCGFVENEIT